MILTKICFAYKPDTQNCNSLLKNRRHCLINKYICSMDSQMEFITLMQTMNFGENARNAIVEFCAENLSDLARLPKKTLDTGIENLHKSLANLPAARRVRLNATKCTLLHSLRMHFNDRLKCGALLEAPAIQALTIENITTMKDEYLETESMVDEVSGLVPVVVTKLEPSKWSLFKTSMIEYFSRIKGKNGIPLSYVSRTNLTNDFEGTYESRVDKLIACTTLRGAKFSADNGTVFSLLIQHTTNTEGYSLVQQYERSRNGRSAWTSLLNHFEGSTFRERVAQDANNMLRSATYSGPRRSFSFSSYYDRHSQAHNKLRQAGKPMTVEQQIDTFVQGIQCATTQSIVVNLAGDIAARTSFESYYNAVASRLELSLSLTQTHSNRETRNVNEFASGKRKNAPSKGKNPRDERNRKNPKSNDINKDFVAENKSYPPNIWKSLSSSNKEKVKAMYKTNRGSNANAQNNNYQARNNIGNNMSYFPNRQVNNTNSQTNTHLTQQPGTMMVPYQSHLQDNRSVASVSLPPYPSSINVPPPPPPPYPSGRNPNMGHIDTSTGEVGQQFGGYNGHFQ